MIHVLKIGGGAGIDAAPALHNLAERVRNGERWVLVHGASAAADALAARMGAPVETITGPGGHVSRYTPPAMIDLYCAAAASVNQQIAAILAGLDVSAVGLAGPNVIAARRKTAIRALRDGRPIIIRDDCSGTITGVNGALLDVLLNAGFTPVIAPVALGEEGERLNVDGDLVAAAVARELGAETCIILSNVPGLLRDTDNPASLVRRIGQHEIDAYEALAQGRMKKKLLAARQAQPARVILSSAGVTRPLDAALNGSGTHIVAPEVVYAGNLG